MDSVDDVVGLIRSINPTSPEAVRFLRSLPRPLPRTLQWESPVEEAGRVPSFSTSHPLPRLSDISPLQLHILNRLEQMGWKVPLGDENKIGDPAALKRIVDLVLDKLELCLMGRPLYDRTSESATRPKQRENETQWKSPFDSYLSDENPNESRKKVDLGEDELADRLREAMRHTPPREFLLERRFPEKQAQTQTTPTKKVFTKCVAVETDGRGEGVGVDVDVGVDRAAHWVASVHKESVREKSREESPISAASPLHVHHVEKHNMHEYGSEIDERSGGRVLAGRKEMKLLEEEVVDGVDGELITEGMEAFSSDDDSIMDVYGNDLDAGERFDKEHGVERTASKMSLYEHELERQGVPIPHTEDELTSSDLSRCIGEMDKLVRDIARKREIEMVVISSLPEVHANDDGEEGVIARDYADSVGASDVEKMEFDCASQDEHFEHDSTLRGKDYLEDDVLEEEEVVDGSPRSVNEKGSPVKTRWDELEESIERVRKVREQMKKLPSPLESFKKAKERLEKSEDPAPSSLSRHDEDMSLLGSHQSTGMTSRESTPSRGEGVVEEKQKWEDIGSRYRQKLEELKELHATIIRDSPSVSSAYRASQDERRSLATFPTDASKSASHSAMRSMAKDGVDIIPHSKSDTTTPKRMHGTAGDHPQMLLSSRYRFESSPPSGTKAVRDGGECEKGTISLHSSYLLSR
eukprot:TRINITY_DN23928_c0_g1_i1.p1 TRINITY_DN23928_c0_g1~~TRINITY_DN23928_c0_g1_i1.p1  ORF type:complete len:695 (+),score=203.18 TRINITY_DN23928_c0_g1_i1:58-2142(+)